MYAKIFLLQLFISIPFFSKGQLRDSFLVQEKFNGYEYNGYIMPLNSDDYYREVKFVTEFVPTISQIKKCENSLKVYLDSFCKSPSSEVDSVDCKVIHDEFKKYFRQYMAYIVRYNSDTTYDGYEGIRGHRYLYILFVSPSQQGTLNEMKKKWMQNIYDGGALLFHATIDIDTGKVIRFNDNGWG